MNDVGDTGDDVESLTLVMIIFCRVMLFIMMDRASYYSDLKK